MTEGAQTRAFSFDDLSRLTSETNPETGTVSYIYDSDTTTCKSTSQGDLIRKTDALANVTCYFYDALHRITGITYPSGPYSTTPSKTFVYDNSSVTINGTAIPISYPKTRMVEAYTGPSIGKVTDEAFSYDARGDLTDVYQWSTHSGGTYHLTNSYYPNGSLETLSSAGLGPTLTYDVDGEGRISAVSASSGLNPLTSATYNNSSQVTGVTYGSGDTDSFSFDPNMGIPTGYTINVGTKSQAATMTNNENGSLKTLAVVDGFYANENQTCQYLYDSDFRLGSADCGSIWKSYYTYDQYGNITKSAGAGPGTTFSPTYNTTTNRYSSIPGGTVTYDGNGNLTNDTFHTYAWDADGNPTTISAKTFLYDAFDRRVDYCSGSSWTQYLYAPSSPGAIVGVGASQTLGLRIQLPGGGQAITNSTAVTDYRRSNWQGSQPIDSSTTQTVLSDAAYTPFGEHYQENGYSGYYAGNLSIWSSFMDGYAATNRLYHYDQGRWVSPDPAGLNAVDPTNPQSWNRYAYVLNNPLGGTDPSGMFIHAPPPCWYSTPGETDGPCDAFGSGFLYDTCGFLLAVTGGGPAPPGCGSPGTTFAPPNSGVGGASASSNAPVSPVSAACRATLLGMLNSEHGTNFTDANITTTYNNGTAGNLIIDASGLSAAQFNSFQPGRYTNYGGQFLFGFGLAGHIANEPNVNPRAVFSNMNVGGNLSVHFAFHDDHGFANNPLGVLLHFFTDVLGHNSRKPC